MLDSAAWVEDFKTFLHPTDTQLFSIVSYVLSVPISNTFWERVFSIMNRLWSDNRNSLSIDPVKVELLTNLFLNFNMTFADFDN